VQDMKLNRQRVAMSRDVCVDSVGVTLQLMKLIIRQCCHSAVRSRANLQISLHAVMLY
jgi:hypothetical protein